MILSLCKIINQYNSIQHITMLKIGNLKSTEEALKEYIANGDYSLSFVMAGWKDIGKSYLVHKAKEQSTLKAQTYSLIGLHGKELAEKSFEIFKLATAPKNEPTVIIVNINLESSLRGLLKNGLDIHLVRYDDKEQHNWMDNPEKQEGLSESDIKLYKDLASVTTPQNRNLKTNEIFNKEFLGLMFEIQCCFEDNKIELLKTKLEELYNDQLLTTIEKAEVLRRWGDVKEYFEDYKKEQTRFDDYDFMPMDATEEEKAECKIKREKEKADKTQIFDDIDLTISQYLKQIEENFF